MFLHFGSKIIPCKEEDTRNVWENVLYCATVVNIEKGGHDVICWQVWGLVLGVW